MILKQRSDVITLVHLDIWLKGQEKSPEPPNLRPPRHGGYASAISGDLTPPALNFALSVVFQLVWEIPI